MKKHAFVGSLAVLFIVVLITGTAWARDPFYDRIHDQQRQIVHGVKTGMLTPGEADILQGNLDHIRGKYQQYKADGLLTRHELRRLNQMLDENNRMIRRLRHNSVRRLY
ncbi:MAG: hypothetical protein ABFD97_15255 [Syntrophobacter sp.]